MDRSRKYSLRPVVSGALALAALLSLAGCAIGDFLERKSSEQVLVDGASSLGPIGRIASIRSMRSQGRVSYAGSEEPFLFDEIDILPLRSITRLSRGDEIWIVERTGTSAKVRRSADGGRSFSAPIDAGSAGPPLEWERWMARGRSCLPYFFRRALGVNAAISEAVSGRGERAIALTSPGDAPAGAAGGADPAGWVLYFDSSSGRPMRASREIDLSGEPHQLEIRFEQPRSFAGVLMPCRQVASLDGELLAVSLIETIEFNASVWPQWMVAHVDFWKEDPFPWTRPETEPSDLMYAVQESMFGTRLERAGQPGAGLSRLATLYLEGKVAAQPQGRGEGTLRLWVSEAGRFRLEERYGEERRITLFDATDGPGRVITAQGERGYPREEVVRESWLLRSFLIRPLVRESLNARFRGERGLVMRVRSGVRERVAVDLLVQLAPRSPRIESVEVGSLGDAEKRRGRLDLEYSGREIAAFRLIDAGRSLEVTVRRLDRGVAIPSQAFRDPAWSG